GRRCQGGRGRRRRRLAGFQGRAAVGGRPCPRKRWTTGGRQRLRADHSDGLLRGRFRRGVGDRSAPSAASGASPDRGDGPRGGAGMTALSTMTSADVRWVVAQAARAPSIHNTQPWLFNWDGCSFELRADTHRGLSAIDPDGRELVLSCGAALYNLRLALRKL